VRYCRFLFEGQAHYGKVEDRANEPWIVDLAPAPPEDLSYHLARAHASKLVPDPAGLDFEPIPLEGVDLLPPATPSKIVCVGRNYREHAAELGNQVPAEPLLFFKPPSSLLRPGGTILLPLASSRVDHEGELAIVIAQRASRLQPDFNLRSVVRGYTLANDVTARDLQKKDGQWTRAKGFDTFCPLGPWISDEVDPATGLTLETRVNGELRQQGSTADFIFTIPQLLAYITAAITLESGDLVLTGTPSGVGPLASGDRVAVAAPGLGTLVNSVASESA
jgi:2-keto-4-pentenoate hydratase/2-oxohepta-3-ene-1,7-dioic acid hydratase in catechol pathway